MQIEKILNQLDKNSILVVNNDAKTEIIKYKSSYEVKHKKLLTFKVLSEDDFLSLISFKYDDELILNSLLNLKLPISIIYEMLEFAKYDKDNHPSLSAFYRENERFIYHNESFINALKDKTIYFLDEPIYFYKFIEKFNLTYKVIENDLNHTPLVKKFSSKENEILYLFESILNDIKNGYDLSDIYIANASTEDIKQIKRFSTIYKLPVNFNDQISINDYKLTRELLKLSLNELLEKLKHKDQLIGDYQVFYDANPIIFEEIYKAFIDIINKYPTKYDDDLLMKVINYELKHKKIKLDKFKSAIQMATLDQIAFLSDKRIYIIHAVYEQFPTIFKDNAFLSDKEKELIGYPTSKDLNIYMTNKLNQLIKSPNIIYISYALKDKYLTYSPSDILTSYLKDNLDDLDISKLESNKGLNLYKLHYKSKDKGNQLITFDSSFNLNDEEKKQLSIYLKQKLFKLSPTAISNYIKSPFIFYLKHILMLSNYEIDVNGKIGTYFHTLVEVLYQLKFSDKIESDFIDETDSEINIYIENHLKKAIDLNTLFDDIKNIYFKDELQTIESIKTQEDMISLDKKLAIETIFFVEKNRGYIINSLNHLLEFEDNEPSKKLMIEKEVNYLNYKGRVDLIKIHQEDNQFSVIDFKSSSKEAFNKDKMLELLMTLDEDFETKINLGQLSLLQLMIYAYLISITQDELKFRDAAYFSFLSNDLKFNSLQTKELDKKLYTSTKSRVISEEELEVIFMKLESLLGEIDSRIRKIDFDNKVRQSIDYKKNLKVDEFGSFQAIAFFTKYNLEVEDESFEDN